jgi:hypothetical protein
MLKVFEELLKGPGGAEKVEKVEKVVGDLDKEHLQVRVAHRQCRLRVEWS